MIKWRLWFALVVGTFLGILFYKNSKLYPRKNTSFIINKSVLEGGFILLSAAYLPVLLVVFGVKYLTDWIGRPFIKIVAQVLAAVFLTIFTAGNFAVLELVCLVSIFSIEPLSKDIMSWYREKRRKQKTLNLREGKDYHVSPSDFRGGEQARET